MSNPHEHAARLQKAHALADRPRHQRRERRRRCANTPSTSGRSWRAMRASTIQARRPGCWCWTALKSIEARSERGWGARVVRAALYARVSTTDQNCEVQLRELQRCRCPPGLGSGGRVPSTRAFPDRRPAGRRSIALSDEPPRRAMRSIAVMVWKMDRFGRSVLHLSQQLATLTSQGVRFIAVSQAIDTDASNPASRLLLTILAGVAEFEREIIRERTLSGVRAAQARGKALGRPRRVFRRDEVAWLRAEGRSWRAIAAALGVPLSTIRDAMRCAENVPGVCGNRPQATETQQAVNAA